MDMCVLACAWLCVRVCAIFISTLVLHRCQGQLISYREYRKIYLLEFDNFTTALDDGSNT